MRITNSATEVRLYDRLFKEAHPGAGDRDYPGDINPDPVRSITTQLELSLKDAKPEDRFQFEWHGYFVADMKASKARTPVFNRTITLRDVCSKVAVRRLIFNLLYLSLFIQTGISPAFAADLTGSKKVSLKTDVLHAENTTRVMLYSTDFSIYPKLNQSPMYLGNQYPPGTSPAAAVVGAILAGMLITKVSDVERDSTIAFSNQIHEALSAININDELESSLRAELLKNEALKNLEFEQVVHIHDLAQPGLLIRIQEKTILTLATYINFDAKLQSLCLTTTAKLWLKDVSTPAYFSDLSYASPTLSETGKSDLRQKWTANSGELLCKRIKEGIAEIAYMLAKDLTDKSSTQTSPSAIKMEVITPSSGKKVETLFYALEEKPERLIGRPDSLDSSLLMSIPKK